jgi:hypothetical protein
VVFCAQTRKLGMGEYVQESRRQGYATVHFADRRDLLNYLTGETSDSKNIDLALPSATTWFQIGPHGVISALPTVSSSASATTSNLPSSSASSSSTLPLGSSLPSLSALPSSSAAAASAAANIAAGNNAPYPYQSNQIPASNASSSAATSNKALDEPLRKRQKIDDDITRSAAFQDIDQEVVKEIQQRERVLRDRKSVLLCEKNRFQICLKPD